MQTFSDEELVGFYLETRQDDYFDQLYQRYCHKVHNKCLSFTKDSIQAQDFTQDVFLRLFVKLGSFKRQAKFSTWLYSITHNYCTDQVRSPRHRQHQLLTEGWENLNTGTDDGLSEVEEANARYVQLAMLRLSADEQRLLRQKYQAEASIRDMANWHSLTESAIKMRLKRSRDRLRQYYWEGARD